MNEIKKEEVKTETVNRTTEMEDEMYEKEKRLEEIGQEQEHREASSDQAAEQAIMAKNYLDAIEGEKALTELKPQLDRIQPSEVRKLNLSGPHVVGMGLSYAKSFAEDRPLFEATFNKDAFDVEEYDNMEKRAKAFWQADIQLRQAIGNEGPLQALLAAARPLRTKMLRTAVYLWEDDYELGDVVANIRSGNGRVNNADDLGGLATLLSEHWEYVEANSSVTRDDIIQAQSLGASILRAMSPIRTEMEDDLRDQRNRAGEYLRRGIEEIRACAAYIHRNDPEEMERYPSLFVRSRKKRTNGKAKVESHEQQVVAQAPVSTAPVEHVESVEPAEQTPTMVEASPPVE